MPEPEPEIDVGTVDERVVRALLVLLAVAAAVAAAASFGWWRAAGSQVTMEDLLPPDRQRLLGDMLARSPGLYRPVWYTGFVGYTLVPSREHEAWGLTFQANERGFRSPPSAKGEDVFRIVFVGDSWTFGMGVSAQDAFPAKVAALANEHAGLGQRVEAWTVALPGYNTFNQLAAFWFLFDELGPDAVVIGPTSNDNHSTTDILPNGSQWRGGTVPDLFGDPHTVTYHERYLDTHRFRTRWQASFAAIRATEERLQKHGIPLVLAFLARWNGPYAHHLVAEAGVEAPYVIVPVGLTLGEWTNPPPVEHGNPAANRRYARLVYKGLADRLGWPATPPSPDDIEGEVHRGGGDPTAWAEAATRLLRGSTRRFVPETFRPAPEALKQAAGPLNLHTGMMGRATTVLVRRVEGAKRLRLQVRRVRHARGLFPQTLRVQIPSPSGGTEDEFEIPADGPPRRRFSVRIPGDLPVGTALDVVFEVDGVKSVRGLDAEQALVLEAIDPVIRP